MKARPRQGDLFGRPEVIASPGTGAAGSPAPLPLERNQLLAWQERLAAYQAPLWSAAEDGPPAQADLFADPAGLLPPDPALDPLTLARRLHPLSLPPESLSFWRWPQAPHGGPAVYLVLDRPTHLSQPLLLYVGETARADRRWKGAHDCKSYLAAYREALMQVDLPATLSIRFWCDAPGATGSRRAVEQALIQRWKPPFNKETRARWSTPFTADVD